MTSEPVMTLGRRRREDRFEEVGSRGMVPAQGALAFKGLFEGGDHDDSRLDGRPEEGNMGGPKGLAEIAAANPLEKDAPREREGNGQESLPQPRREKPIGGNIHDFSA